MVAALDLGSGNGKHLVGSLFGNGATAVLCVVVVVVVLVAIVIGVQKKKKRVKGEKEDE